MLRLNKKLFSRRYLIIAVLGLLLLYFVVGLIKEIVNNYRVEKQIGDLTKQVGQLEQENNEIGGLIENWANSNNLEKEARLKLGLQKPGEKAVLILRGENEINPGQIIDPRSETLGSLVVTPKKDNYSNPFKWWLYFFGPKEQK